MSSIDIPAEVSQFCIQHYALIRAWVNENEQMRSEMESQFPYRTLLWSYPVFKIDEMVNLKLANDYNITSKNSEASDLYD